ncbi:hypothetical protein BCR35DRAFT_211731 [Leucosporidium creatinivorum]|uniref:F-box domain-containing protein n=1 Tax=Leucosporidium creatinivorum TaxID=106004 RepID=A0A1Y2DCX1_9BASI|nr:hypothetical protein BCR35DRAFT_211731 [Leucosporidium creatinivorum]
MHQTRSAGTLVATLNALHSGKLPSPPRLALHLSSNRAFASCSSTAHFAFVTHLRLLAMDMLSTQKPTSITHTRPQQPADSPAAALPTETLQHILRLALEGEDAWRRQSTRLSFRRVCTLWWKVAEVGTELAVKDTMMAEWVAKQLKAKGGKARRERVRSLDLNIEFHKTTGKGNRLAGLIVACPSLEKLEMHSDNWVRLGTDSALNKPLVAALIRLSKLKHFSYRAPHDFRLQKLADFGKIISSWPNLITLIIPKCCAWSWNEEVDKDRVNLPSPIPIQYLHLPLGAEELARTSTPSTRRSELRLPPSAISTSAPLRKTS